MKLTNILLGCLIVLIGVMVYNQFSNKPETIVVTPDPPDPPTPDPDDPDDPDPDDPDDPDPVNPDDPSPVTPTVEKNIVTCKACLGGVNKAWEDKKVCSVCGGVGTMEKSAMEKRYKKWLAETITCTSCQGTGQSYRRRVTPFTDLPLNVLPGEYDCKVCKGKKSGVRGELIKNFDVAQKIYPPTEI